MGHRSDDTFQHYISSVSGVDSQSIMLDRDPDTQTVEFLRSMITSLDPKAPPPPGSLLARSGPVKVRERYLEEREEYFKSMAAFRVRSEQDCTTEAPSDQSGIEEHHMARPLPSTYFRAFLRYDEDRAAVIQNF